MATTADDKVEVGQVESADQKPADVEVTSQASRSQRFKRHCVRRWWIWLTGFLIFAVVIIIIIIFGVVPPVAQKGLDHSHIWIQELSILESAPRSLLYGQNTVMGTGGGVAARAKLDPFTMQFSLVDKPTFMTLDIPFKLGGADYVPLDLSNVSTPLPDADAFLGFASALMDSESFSLDLSGKTTLRLGGIHTKVKYRKRPTIKGFNKLKGMVITSYTLLQGQNIDYNIEGKVVIPNPTVFTLQIGDVYLDFNLTGSYLGNGLIPALTVTPGLKNTYDFKGNISLSGLSRLITATAKGENLKVQAKKVVTNGQTVPWLDIPLTSVIVDVPVNTSYDFSGGETDAMRAKAAGDVTIRPPDA